MKLTQSGKQFNSACDSVHLLSDVTSGRPYHQVVFGTSNIVGDLGYAIDGAFERINNIEQNENQEIRMVHQLAFDRLASDEEIELVKKILIPTPEKRTSYNTSYGVFLGYSLGLGKGYDILLMIF